MKIKYIFLGGVALFAITATNYFLWHFDYNNEEKAKNKTEIVKKVDEEKDMISDNYEYPAPVKQLQQVIVKSYQPPAHEGEDIFPNELLQADKEYTNSYEDKGKIDELRKRINQL